MKNWVALAAIVAQLIERYLSYRRSKKEPSNAESPKSGSAWFDSEFNGRVSEPVDVPTIVTGPTNAPSSEPGKIP